MKHAYMIIANKNWAQLRLLLSLLDDERNDLYVMIDQKASFSESDEVYLASAVSSSKLEVMSTLKIYWGGYTQVQAELQLLERAVSNGPYAYYHLLSGSDLPLVPQDEIHSFFDEHQGYEFLTFSEAGGYESYYQRVKYRYHMSRLTPRITSSKVLKKGIRLFRKCDLAWQRILKRDNWKQINGDLKLYYGSNWFSITDGLAKYILKNKEWIEKSFKESYLCDELFIHTLVMNSDFYKKVYYRIPTKDIPTELQGNLRYINWWDGSPYTWNLDKDNDNASLKLAKGLGHLFARKFNLTSKQIEEISDAIFSKVRVK